MARRQGDARPRRGRRRPAERVADAAGRRGGLASRARVLAQASELTPPGRLKYARLVDAAEAALGSGAAQLAKTYLDDVDEDALDAVSRAARRSARASRSSPPIPR